MDNQNSKPVILAVEDERSVVASYQTLFEDKYTVIAAETGEEAMKVIGEKDVNLVLLDLMLPDIDGIELLEKIKKSCDAEVIIISAIKMVKTAIQAVRLGAFDYMSKPFDIDELLVTVQKAVEKRSLAKEVIYLKSELKPVTFENMIGKSPAMKQVFAVMTEVCKNHSTVLITGESGTGKELIARAIHYSGALKDKPFVAVDSATIPENLVESELFGHEKGSFTDATAQKIGKFELADTGTLFLDEIGNLPYDIQGKILRAIEEREIQRVGGTKTIKIDVRIISATNLDLKKAVNEGRFRQDLYYRLNVIPIFVPPLRERADDIPLLIDHFIRIYNKRFGKAVSGISKDALSLLMEYKWPGNVRELRNVIERLVALGKENVIAQNRLPIDILLADEKPAESKGNISLKAARDEFEKQFIMRILEKAGWNQTKAAQVLGIHRNALIYKINQFGIRTHKDRLKGD